MSCEKLPPIIPLESTGMQNYLSDLYRVYQEQIANGSFTFHNKPIHVFTSLNHNLQHQSFEHLTTKGSGDRLYNVRRCERLPWIKSILEGNCNSCEEFLIFQDKNWHGKKNTKRYVLWCPKEDYVIILEEREKEVMLITAYCVLYENKRNDLRKMYQNSQ